MAFFAFLAGIPPWFLVDYRTDLVLFVLLVPLVLIAAAGALMGALLQPLAIGPRSNLFRAALMGTVCAVLSMPVLILFFGLFFETNTILIEPIDSLKNWAALTIMGLLTFWWLVIPLGALSGLTLQIAWMRCARRVEHHKTP